MPIESLHILAPIFWKERNSLDEQVQSVVKKKNQIKSNKSLSIAWQGQYLRERHVFRFGRRWQKKKKKNTGTPSNNQR